VAATGAESAAPLLFMLIPRHPQRFEQAAGQLQSAGLPFVRRTRLLDLGDGGSSALAACREAAVVLGDTLGEMPWYYAGSQVAIVGGGFAPLGGQNFIEASALGCPVVVGPHKANFQQAVADAHAAGANAQAADPEQALRQALRWLDDPALAAQVGRAGHDWVRQHAGAVARVMNGIEDLRAQRPA
jgi:3-deoxy-D-manno-octulosonic-acid transferase